MSAQGGMRSIQGVPRLTFGQWKDCTYGGAVTVLMNTIGVPVTYEDVMGLSGACYRICMKEDWCPSAGMPQCGYDVETPLYRALGFEVYRIRDDRERREKVVACIDKGIPVLAGEQRGSPEWGLITGYASQGAVLYGRTYWDSGGANPEEVFTDDKYFLADKYPGFDVQFFDRKAEPIAPKAALKQSLETCLGTLHQGPSEDGYVRGYQAYELWIRGLEDPDKFGEFQALCDADRKQNRLEESGSYRGFPAGANGYHLDCLRDARRCACIYLENSLPLLEGERRRRLEKAASLYRAMFDNLMAVAPYEGTETSFNGKVEDWDMGKRREFASVLREVYAMEKQVEVECQAVLESWDE